MVRDVASGREIHDFRHSGKQKQGRKDDTSRKSRYINFNVERQKILSHCHVVCSTLSGAGSKAFIESGKSENHSYSNLLKYMSLAGERLTKVKCAPPVSRDEFPHSEFDAVIIDEACQGSEMSCLIPFKYNPNAVVLVGDPNQLPVMTFSQDASRCKADRSLFDRLHLTGLPINMLRIQYRMHPAIVQFPSKTFYNNKIITCDKINNRRPAIWHDHVAFPPYLLVSKASYF
jgi:senataxin